MWGRMLKYMIIMPLDTEQLSRWLEMKSGDVRVLMEQAD